MRRLWHSRTFRVGRVCFRWLRITCWFLLLALVCALVYLNQLGLPDFAKRRLIDELRARGIRFEYDQMRLDFYGGIVAEKVRIGAADDPNSPTLFLETLGLQLEPGKLYRQRSLEVESLDLIGGHLTMPVGLTNGPRTNLVVEGIEGRVGLLADDVWQLQELRARSLGAHLILAGTVTNASALRLWKIGSGRRGEAAWREYLRRVIEVAGQFKFNGIPELRGRCRLDAASPMSAQARFELSADGARTPWGDARKFSLQVHSIPATNRDEILGANVELSMVGAATPWGYASELKLRTRTRPVSTPGAWPGAGLTIEAIAPETRWGSAESLQLDFTLADVQTNLTGLQGHVVLNARQPRTKWVSAESLRLTAHAAQLPAGAAAAADPAWGWWADLSPYELDWKIDAQAVATEKATVDQFHAAGHWRAPGLVVDRLDAGVAGGRLIASARLDVGTRDASAQADIDFDVKKLDRLLTPGALKWLGQYHWDRPPIASARGGARLPPWNAQRVDWRAEVVPTLWLGGALTNQSGAFRDVRFERARLDFQFSNQVWNVRNVVVDRPEGKLRFDHVSDERTKDYSFEIRSGIDVTALRPWLEAGGQRVLDDFKFTAAPAIEGTLWGRWRAPERTGFRAHVHATNFMFRGETVSDFEGRLQFTNRVVTFQDARLRRPEGEATVAAGRYDIAGERLFLTNALSTVEPGAILRPIGPKTAATMEPYQFDAPPKVTVNGVIHTRDTAKMDLRFHVEGGPFRWSRFNLPTVSADLHWANNGLVMSNVAAAFYDGKISGGAQFDFSPPEGTAFSFNARVWESDLRKLLTDVTAKSNKVEGVLNGQLNVYRARSWDWTSWQGYGQATLRDGLLWDAPLFGFLSMPLNLVAPGLGNSRASAATATYTITNSVIHTSDLEILAGTMRLTYRGMVDFDTKVDARVEAELLRDTGVIGKIVNLALMPLTKLLEYKVTGTLGDPNPQPLYVLPRVLLFPLSPVKTLKDIFPPEDKAPPAAAPAPPPR